MEDNGVSQLEFGDFENTYKELCISNGSVELPSSWSMNINQLAVVGHYEPLVKSNSELMLKSSHTNGENDEAYESIEYLKKLNVDAGNRSCDTASNQEETENLQQPSQLDQGVNEHEPGSYQDNISSTSTSELDGTTSGVTDNIACNEQQSMEVKQKDVTACEIETDNATPTKPSLQPSWASLFHADTVELTSTNSAPTMNGIPDVLVAAKMAKTGKQAAKESTVGKSSAELNDTDKKANIKPSVVTVVKPNEDPHADALASKLNKLELVFKPQAFIPRGLINTSNWCYINATLQALLVCPPFYHLLKSLPYVKPENLKTTSTPVLDCFIQLASEFRSITSKRGYQCKKEVRHGPPFAPQTVYDMLSVIKSSLSERGSQEDAEEFLTCVLNEMHEEVTHLFNHFGLNPVNSPAQEMENNGVFDNMHEQENPEEWEEVVTTKRNRSVVTRRADSTKTPISQMFRGELCTSVLRPGQKASISYEPFFCLPLDVPVDHPASIERALHFLTGKERFFENDSDSDASRQQNIEVLPPILILHLKRFVYDAKGGSKKIDKKMEFKTDLTVNKEMLSKSARKYTLSQRSYKLFAVVYHHGEKVTGGHYTTDVFHIGLSSWLRIDDQNIWSIPRNEVIRHSLNRTPYLLYYRRTDLD